MQHLLTVTKYKCRHCDALYTGQSFPVEKKQDALLNELPNRTIHLCSENSVGYGELVGFDFMPIQSTTP